MKLNNINKSKVENGEVIDRFENDESLWIEVENDPSIGDSGFRSELSFDRVKAFITNALNQQRLEIVGEIEKYLRLDWKPTEGYDSEEEKGFQKGIIAEQGQVKKKLNEFLTKLEGKE